MQNQEKIIQAIAACLEKEIRPQFSGKTEYGSYEFRSRGVTSRDLMPKFCQEIAREILAAIAPYLEAGAGLSEAKDIIVKVAASLVRQQASEYAEDLDLPKTTPITAIRKFETEAQNWNDRNRLRAIELKRAYDLLK